MSIETVLTHLDNARGALVESLGSKGVTVDSSATIYSCASAILTIPDGSGGTDVSSTTAEASDVLAGKVFYNSGGVQTSGTIPTVSASLSANVVTIPSGYVASQTSVSVGSAVSAATITPTTSNQVISSGGYLAGNQTILGDANLVGSNIASGVSIFGVPGTLVTSGGTMDFYKCSWVAIGGSSWHGYHAILTSGVYAFESSVTSGLTYLGPVYGNSSFVPQIGKVYNNGATVEAKLFTAIPEPNLYFPLGDSIEAETETDLPTNESGSMAFINNSYALFNGNSCLEMPSTLYGMFNSRTSLFCCGWFKFTGTSDDSYWLWAVGYSETVFGVRVTKGRTNEISLDVRGSSGSWGPDNSLQTSAFLDGEWHFFAFYSKSGGTQFACIDTTYQTNTTQSQFYPGPMSNGTVGARMNWPDYPYTGLASQLRIVFDQYLDLPAFQRYCAAYKEEFTPPSND